MLSLGRDGNERQHVTSSAAFARRFRGVAVHGGANPVLVRRSNAEPYFLSVFHTKDARLRYQNYVYTFSASPPFGVLAVGRQPLSLHGRRVRFVRRTDSARRRAQRPLLGVSYGVDDMAARLAVAPLSTDARRRKGLAPAAPEFDSAAQWGVRTVPWSSTRTPHRTDGGGAMSAHRRLVLVDDVTTTSSSTTTTTRRRRRRVAALAGDAVSRVSRIAQRLESTTMPRPSRWWRASLTPTPAGSTAARPSFAIASRTAMVPAG